jgi:DNA-binding transcriptional ArsR family regulator
MALPSPIPERLVELIAERFRLLSEPSRIRLLDRLRADGEAAVGELAGELGTSQQNVSKHLGALHGAGVVSRRREGNRVIYSISDEDVLTLCEAVCGGLERQAGEVDALLRGAA